MERYLTAAQVAERLQVSVSWVYKHQELLGAVRLGERLLRFPEQRVAALLAQAARPRRGTGQGAAGATRPVPRRWQLD